MKKVFLWAGLLVSAPDVFLIVSALFFLSGILLLSMRITGFAAIGIKKRPGPDSNRRIAVLQTAAFPLGYQAFH